MSLFEDVLTLDQQYADFMRDIREELSSHIGLKSAAYNYDFYEDVPLKDFERVPYVWECDEKPGKADDQEAMFGFQGRQSMASMATMSTLQTLDPESEIPDIPFSRLGGTSLTNEEIANFIPPTEECEELSDAEEGSAQRVRSETETGEAQSPGSLLFRRQ